ncbi:hypothetical protein DZF91_34895 [Actinomadura logoneensis]|uniref:Uncharacterized protein n=1 Tax=Actinomadura logoneensis TaxID=2293572 RepID=A0A372JCD8_9ACTN|nr:hypothetical protein DZF91_34895 [Actinomadura logoneensis]
MQPGTAHLGAQRLDRSRHPRIVAHGVQEALDLADGRPVLRGDALPTGQFLVLAEGSERSQAFAQADGHPEVDDRVVHAPQRLADAPFGGL